MNSESKKPTYADLAQSIGSEVLATLPMTGSRTQIKMLVKILNVRNRYGHWDFLVRPVGGEGEVWIERERVEAGVSQTE